MYLLDTDTLVFALRGHSCVMAAMAARARTPKALSVITYGELYHGALRSARREEQVARVRRTVELFSIIDVTPRIMETFASLKAEMQEHGNVLDNFDLIIAATALWHDYTVVTNNERHFQAVPGLRVENWVKPGGA